jgi:threonine synthase
LSYVERFVCSKCGSTYEPEESPVMCRKRDLGRLDVEYDYDAVSSRLTRGSLKARETRDIWRYEELLPVRQKFGVRLGEGNTTLIHARRLGEKLGMSKLYLKDETRNPTASFKDRAMAVGIAKAVELGKRDVAIASSGNAAASLAAYSAAAGIRCHAYVPDDAAIGKIAQLLLYGATTVRCKQEKEGEDATVQAMLNAVDERGYYPCPSFGPFNPYQVEGPKTIPFELYEQHDWDEVSAIIVPTGSGCLLTGVWKGLQDLKEIGMVDSYPRLISVQPKGNQALTKAINRHLRFDQIVAEAYPKSVASGLLDPFPWDGDSALEGVEKTRGAGVFVDDPAIMGAVRDLAAYEGVFAEPSGAAGLAGLRKLLKDGTLKEEDTAVVLVTGSGLKEPDKVVKMYEERNQGRSKKREPGSALKPSATRADLADRI